MALVNICACTAYNHATFMTDTLDATFVTSIYCLCVQIAMFAQAAPCILCAFQVLHKLWSTLINTRPPAWYVGKLPDEKLIIKELGPNIPSASLVPN